MEALPSDFYEKHWPRLQLQRSKLSRGSSSPLRAAVARAAGVPHGVAKCAMSARWSLTRPRRQSPAAKGPCSRRTQLQHNASGRAALLPLSAVLGCQGERKVGPSPHHSSLNTVARWHTTPLTTSWQGLACRPSKLEAATATRRFRCKGAKRMRCCQKQR